MLRAAVDVLAKLKVEVVLDEEGITGPDGNRLVPKDLIDLKSMSRS